MIKDFSNINNETLNDLPERVIGCNINNCEIDNAQNTVFERCNISHSSFKTASSFERTNLIMCELAEGSIYDRTNIIDEEDEELD